MNISEIAKKADVSIATISRALNPDESQKVAPDTLNRIHSLVKKYGYAPNLGAQSMRCSAFRTVGVVLPHFRGIFYTDYYVQVLNGVSDALLDSGYHFKLIMLQSGKFHWDEDNNIIYINSKEADWDKYNFKTAEGVDGLIVAQWPLFFSDTRALQKLNIPCVAVNDPESCRRVNFLTEDSRMGGELAAQYLYSKGHRRIVVLTGISESRESFMRVKGFKAFFDKMKVRTEIIILRGDFHERKAARVVESFYKTTKRKVTAFFCCNDLMAFGVINKLRELGLSCPKDVSVIGYDDDRRAEFFEPPLTTIHVPVYELSKEATLRLVGHLKGEIKQPFYGQTLFPVSLVERGSVAAVR